MTGDLFSTFVEGFFGVFTWPVIGFMLLGILVGAVVGLLPGIGAVVALTVLLPFTFLLEPSAAFTLLIATTTVSANASDITSILFGVPGDPASSALILDGYPMARRGEAGRALSANLFASLIGAAVGAFAIVAAIPVVRPLVLSFGSPEFFLATVIGITFISLLSSGARTKGLIAGLVGLLISLVGVDPHSSIPRYTFGRLELWDGIGLAPVALGLFAIPELFHLIVTRASIAQTTDTKLGGTRTGIADVIRHRWLVIRCSLIGTFVGILPGLGAPVSQWMAYGHAVQSSPNKDRFGKGAVEGALGPGAANNSGLGGSLIPTIGFGVPGSLPMALLLAAFLVHGIVPGPSMLTTNLDLTMSFVWVIVISNVIFVVAALPFLGVIAQVTRVPGSLLVPIMTTLVFIGAFAYRGRMLDLGLTLVAGLLGVAMTRLGWPRPPLVLGMVLGGISERYLFTSYSRYEFGFLLRPMVLVLIGVLLVVFLLPGILRLYRGWRTQSHGSDQFRMNGSEDDEPTPALASRIDLNLALGLLAISGGTLAVLRAADWPITARLMPWAVGFPLVAISTLYVVRKLLRRGAEEVSRFEMALTELDRRTLWLRSAIAACWLVGAAAAIWIIGFHWGAPLATAVYVAHLARTRPAAAILSVLTVTLFVWMIHTQLGVRFPSGVLIG